MQKGAEIRVLAAEDGEAGEDMDQFIGAETVGLGYCPVSEPDALEIAFIPLPILPAVSGLGLGSPGALSNLRQRDPLPWNVSPVQVGASGAEPNKIVEREAVRPALL